MMRQIAFDYRNADVFVVRTANQPQRFSGNVQHKLAPAIIM
jgi:hypothetical protein